MLTLDLGREKGKKEYKPGDAATGSINCSCSWAPRFCSYCNHNPKKRTIKITSPRSSEFTSDILIDGVRYQVETEKLGLKKKIIITNVLKDGTIISSKKIDYNDLQESSPIQSPCN